jgi:cell division protein FtsZ
MGGGAPGQGASETSGSGVDSSGAEGDSDDPAQSVAEPVGSYVPAPVSFVSPDEEDDEDAGQSGYSAGDTREDLPTASAWKDSARDKAFDPNSAKRRPVVFEEDDDLDVPDFLK